MAIVEFNAEKNHLLKFMSQTDINIHMTPTVFDRIESDIVADRGKMYSEDEDEIVVNIDVETGGYLFKRNIRFIEMGRK